jgi:hypothetical protein
MHDKQQAQDNMNVHGYVTFYSVELSVRHVVILANVTRPLVLALLAWPRA